MLITSARLISVSVQLRRREEIKRLAGSRKSPN